MNTRPRTYQQLFEARIVLCSALRYIAQQHCSYHGPLATSISPLQFDTAAGKHAFLIVDNLLTELEAEFRAKKRRRAA